MQWIIKYLVSRLRERSTIVTLLTTIFGAIGIKLAPDATESIITGILGILTAVGFLTKESED